MNSKTITLDTPIKRGDTLIDSLTLRKPGAGELRGCAISDLARMDVATLVRVIPRISTPSLTEHEVSGMDLADLTELASEVAGFLLKKAERASISQGE
ncbi:phage tail assembly protein [Laribacter hongkongensis]|uniref:phage tail assembly protein n=1 Tax=Laribacter hongkongensis TaxID=168471 RepID=UPI001EFC5318|nr:phage tail assembly protein [Laribacter hongkongensis]MCG9005138.1 phage tail assembly protein [Laribacter hongkongensis]MCG9045112.1 phage tail assembly protein [Laribacter hongkongensis]MCG9061174.1 phage tail assembly protein [Laribacter hongkongensis]